MLTRYEDNLIFTLQTSFLRLSYLI